MGSIVLLGSAAGIANADTIYVCWDGSGDYLTVQEGIDAARDGDEVVVCDGTYTGPGNKNLDYGGKAITVRSANGPENCIIDCQNSGRGFYFHAGDGPTSIVSGFTITNGNETEQYPWGGGIYCTSSAPTIVNCKITSNAAGRGGGLYLSWSSPTLINCLIVENSASDMGGGIYTAVSSFPVLINCTLSANQALAGGGMYNDGSAGSLINCIVWGNSVGEIMGDTAFVSYSCIQGGYFGTGVIDEDPLFVDPDNDDYHLSPGSPCIDAGCNWSVPLDIADLDNDGDTNEYTPLDLDGEGRFFDDPDTPNYGCCGEGVVVDMGAYEYGGTGPQPCPGDLDGDQDVDQSDLGLLLSCWGRDCGDLDCSGHTNQADVGILLAHWGEGCP